MKPILAFCCIALAATYSTSAQCLKDITDTQPFTVTACDEMPGFPASAAFANDDQAYNGWQSATNPAPGVPCWIMVQLTGGAQTIQGYSITSLDDNSGTADKAPSDWIVEASNDGVSWTTLDTRASEIFSAGGETHIYSFSNATLYSYYRLTVNQTQNISATLAIAGLQLFADVCLQGTVFADNGDRAAAYDPLNDTPLPGVTVNIVVAPAGTVAASAVTDAAGQYSFSAAQVPAVGSFAVIVTPPAGKIFVTRPANVWSSWLSFPSAEEEPADGALLFDYHLSFNGDRAAVNRMLFAGGNIDFGFADAVPPAVFACVGSSGATNLISIAGKGSFGVTSIAWERMHPHQKGFAFSSNVLYTSMPSTYTDYGFNNVPTGSGGARGVLLAEGIYNVASFPGTLSDICYKPYMSSLLNNVRGGWRKSYGITTGDAYDRFLALNGATSGSLPFFKQTGLSLTAGITYTIAFYGKHANSYAQVVTSGVADAQIVVEVLDNGNSVVSSGNLYLNAPTSYMDDRPESPWQLRMFSFTAPGGSGPFTVQLRASTTAAYGNDFYIDNVVLYPCSLILLPLQLADFSARADGPQQVQLRWTIDNPVAAVAEVQHSYDGQSFATIGTVALVPGATDYSFIHRQPGNALHYYRLKIDETKDRSNYSPVKTMDMRSGNGSLLLYPNPVTDEVHIIAADVLSEIDLLDAAGKTIYTIAPGNSRQATVDCRRLAAGLYYIRTTGKAGSALNKIVVKH